MMEGQSPVPLGTPQVPRVRRGWAGERIEKGAQTGRGEEGRHAVFREGRLRRYLHR